MKKMLQIGAGNIGRGFIVRLFYNNGYLVSFADVNNEIINELNIQKKYEVEIAGNEIKKEVIYVDETINSNDQNKFNLLFSSSNIVCLAVGVNSLKYVVLNISVCIKYMYEKKINEEIIILACENYIKASSYLKSLVIKELSNEEIEYLTKYIKFHDVAVDCIVPPLINDNILTVRVEDFYELVIDKINLENIDLLAINDIIFTDNVLAYVERKLFTLNAAHAIIAYLGTIMGYDTVDKAITDQNIEKFIIKLMQKNGEIICTKHKFNYLEHEKYIYKILNRFKNPFLHDELTRVGRELLRKLNYNERLVAPILDAKYWKIECDILYVCIAISLHYQNQNEVDVLVINKMIESRNLFQTIKFLTDLDDESVNSIIEKYDLIESRGIEWIFQL